MTGFGRDGTRSVSPVQLSEGAVLDVVESGVSSSPFDRMDRSEPKTDELGR